MFGIIRYHTALQDLTYHLLESLATCKSCVIVALLANEGVAGGLEQLVEMFEVLLTGVRQDHEEVRKRDLSYCVLIG